MDGIQEHEPTARTLRTAKPERPRNSGWRFYKPGWICPKDPEDTGLTLKENQRTSKYFRGSLMGWSKTSKPGENDKDWVSSPAVKEAALLHVYDLSHCRFFVTFRRRLVAQE